MSKIKCNLIRMDQFGIAKVTSYIQPFICLHRYAPKIPISDHFCQAVDHLSHTNLGQQVSGPTLNPIIGTLPKLFSTKCCI